MSRSPLAGMSIRLVICVLVFARVLCNGKQRFAETPSTYQEVSAGDDVQLRCKVHDKRGNCIWQKDRKPVGMHPDKYELVDGRDGDCTLLIRRASLDFDDGYWECQVTPGDFTQQDALNSLPARLLVRVKPRNPRLEYNGGLLNTAVTLREGQTANVSCVSRYGNPPALIKWFIGERAVEPLQEQNNGTEVDSPKTWVAHSTLQVRGSRENHGLPIKCLAFHPTSHIPAVAESRLDVQYSPEVKLETSPRVLAEALEESASIVSLRCIADSNPAATIKWYKNSSPIAQGDHDRLVPRDGTRNGTSVVSELRFEPIIREDAGQYSCKAANVIGESSPANYKVDVQYGPRLKPNNQHLLNDTSGEVQETTLLGSTKEPFECEEFEANPPPYYRWMHLRGGVMQPVEYPGQNMVGWRKLRLKNIMWSDEGEYRCVAYNVINGVRRERPSDTRFVLHVIGPPQIQTMRRLTGENGIYESISYAGETVHRLKSRFCSRPPPRLVAWEWGSAHIRAGEKIDDKYEALPLEPIIENKEMTNCYWSKLEIKNIGKEDARIYTLTVESEKGKDSTNFKLVVRDPTETRVIAAVAAVALLVLILLIFAGVYSLFRAKHRRYQREEEENSIAADAFYNTSVSADRQKAVQNNANAQNKTFARKTSTDGGLAVMYNYDQVTKHARTMSPEALEVRRAPAVLQPPTIV